MARRVNAETIALVKNHEGLRLKAYADPGYGWAIPTIGYGHTSDAYRKVTPGMTISEAEAEDLLEHDLEEVAAAVRALVKVPLNDNQFGALCSFTFNVGTKAFKRSTLLTKVNAGDFAAAAEEFRRWNKSNGRVLKGLTRRRAEEAALFLLPAAPAPAAPRLWQMLAALFAFLAALLKKVLRK